MILTVKELSAYLKIKEKSIYYFIHKGMPHYRIGKLVRFKSEEIDLWLDSKKVRPTDKKFSKIMETVYNAIEGRPSRPAKGGR